MASLNKVILIGNLCADPERRQSAGGGVYCPFLVAVKRTPSKENGAADFISVITWGKQADFVSRYFRKGQSILICGTLRTSAWTDGGTKRYKTEVLAEEISFVGKKEAQNGTAPALGDQDRSDFEEIADGEELPF